MRTQPMAPAPGAPTAGTGPKAVCGLTLLAGLAWLGLALTQLQDPSRRPDIPYDGSAVLLGFALALSGLLILVFRSGPALGRLLLAAGCATTVSRFLLLAMAVAGAGQAGSDAAAVIRVLGDAPTLFVIYSLPLWIPTGRLPRTWGRPYAALLALWSLFQASADTASEPDWYGLANPLSQFAPAQAAVRVTTAMGAWFTWVLPLSLILVSLLVAVVRSRRESVGVTGNVVLLVPYVAWLAGSYLEDAWADLSLFIGACTAAAWPLLVVYLLGRDRAWHLDRSTRRVLTGSVLAALLSFGFVWLGLALPRLLPATDGAKALLMVACALVVGVLLHPIARGVSRIVERFYYGERAQPYHVVRDLARELSRAVSPGQAPQLLCDTAVRTLGLAGARVVVETRGGPRELAALGTTGPAGQAFPLIFQGAVVGELYAAPRGNERTLDRQDHAMLRILADQAAPAVASLRLYADLVASRRQIVLAREEERKRLRHDLHDGLGPLLSGLRLQVDTARSTLPAESAAADSLGIVSTGIHDAITQLRRITDGLGPGELSRTGLSHALHQLAARMTSDRLRISIDLIPDPLPHLPAAVEVAVYRICAEALNNVLRHSGADRARLALRVGPSEITLETSDDGGGFPTHHCAVGVGLRSMSERAEELGGTLTAANDARGAVVRAVLPLHGEAERAGNPT